VTAVVEDPRCTIEDTSLFSHRRSAPTGRFASVVWLEEAGEEGEEGTP
jgi:copper oxidase (laccase) domain-containing protein